MSNESYINQLCDLINKVNIVEKFALKEIHDFRVKSHPSSYFVYKFEFLCSAGLEEGFPIPGGSWFSLF